MGSMVTSVLIPTVIVVVLEVAGLSTFTLVRWALREREREREREIIGSCLTLLAFFSRLSSLFFFFFPLFR
jgi:hypothetical protein